MSTQKYNRPPIVQAVFEVRFDGDSNKRIMERIVKKLSSRYPNTEQEHTWNFQIDGEKAPEVTQSPVAAGYKLSSSEKTDVVLIKPNSFAVVRHAPYEGWDVFKEEFENVWSVVKKICGFRPVTRLALRYINRLDIPLPSTKHEVPGILEESDYINIAVVVPKDIVPAFNRYNIEFASTTSREFKYTVRTGPAPAPLVDHFSIVLDLDVYKDIDLPQDESAVFSVVEELREEKNYLFENFVTDRAKKLFEREI